MRIRKPVTIAVAVAASAALTGFAAIALMNAPWVYAKPSNWLPLAIIGAMIAAPFVSSQLIAHYGRD